jgi:hypothetical protein
MPATPSDVVPQLPGQIGDPLAFLHEIVVVGELIG